MRTSATIDVALPASEAYAHWSRFESYPRFVEGIRSVDPVDDDPARFLVTGNGTDAWTAQIVERIPGRIVRWQGTDAPHGGTVRFYGRTDGGAKVLLEMRGTGGAEDLAQRTLARFKRHAESRVPAVA